MPDRSCDVYDLQSAADALKASFIASGSSGNTNREGLGMKRAHHEEEEDEYEKLDKTDSVK